MKKFILLSLMVVALSSTLVSCGNPPTKEKSSSSSTGPDIDSLGSDTALYLGVSTEWEDGSGKTSKGTCSVSTMSAPGYEETCTIKVPEGQLYYSSLIFTVGTKISALCPLVKFYPYYYIRSDSATYKPPGDTATVDCSDEDKRDAEKKCWGGAGPQMITGFPKNAGSYHVTAGSESATYTMSASNTIRWDNNGRRSNLMSSNNLPSGSRSTPINGKYWVDTSSALSIEMTMMQDYLVICEDLWAHPIYTIRLNIWDEDTKGQDGTLDEIEDWQ